MVTPRKASTPRRLFLSPTSAKPMYSARSGKRRRLRSSRKSTGPRPTLRSVIQDMTQEKKRREDNIALTSLHTMNTFLVGRNIELGAGTNGRIGGHITLTGINVKGVLQNSSVVADNGIRIVAPIMFRCWIVSTQRNDDPQSYWFQSNNSDANVNYSTGFTNDPTGDVARGRSRLNGQEIKIHAYKSIKLLPKRTAQQNNGSCRTISMYVKLDKVLKYNTAVLSTIPYTPDQVQPNFWICTAFYNADTQTTTTDSFATANLCYTQYFRE